MTLDGVTLFSRIKILKTYEIHVNACQNCLAGFLYVMAENWKNLKVLNAFFIVFCVLESKQISSSA